MREDDKLKDCFNPSKLEPLNFCAIAWWDVSSLTIVFYFDPFPLINYCVVALFYGIGGAQ